VLFCFFKIKQFSYLLIGGLNIGKYPPPPPSGEIIADVIWGKNIKNGREKGGKCKRIRKNRERKRKKGGKNEKRGSKG
jgi:hypothetical protein